MRRNGTTGAEYTDLPGPAGLLFHLNIHGIVPAGGLKKLGKWQASRKKFFPPVKILTRKFQGKFLAPVKQQFPDTEQPLLNACYSKEWVVYGKPLEAHNYFR